jgi:hypothetical protein
MAANNTIPQIGKFWFTDSVEKMIRRNDRLMLKIAEANGNVRVASVERWFKTKDGEPGITKK